MCVSNATEQLTHIYLTFQNLIQRIQYIYFNQNGTLTMLCKQRNRELSKLPSTIGMGNVLSVISDKLIPHNSAEDAVDYWLSDIRHAQDYSPFGAATAHWRFTLHGRDLSLSTTGNKPYRFGFQNQEEDPETGLVNFEYRMHDPRIGRFFAIDPLADKFSYNSPYAFSENCVINSIELEGLEKINHMVYSKKEKAWVIKWVEIDNNLTENVNAYHKFNSKGQNYQTVVKPWSPRKGHTQSVTYDGNIKKDGDNRQNMYQQFESTTDAKKTQSEKDMETNMNNANSTDVTYYDSWEGSDDGANTGGEYSGVKGMRNAGEDLESFGNFVGKIPTPPTKLLGKIY